MSTSISGFFQDKCVFVTGGTGFLGTLLIEKLLYSCGQTGKIYVLMRSKGATGCHGRLEQLLSSKAFDRIRMSKGDLFRRIVPVCGDLSDSNLNIKDCEILDRLRKEVSIVFHMAANVKFNETLSKAVDCNFLGTLSVFEFCRKLTNLEAVIHVSTAYANCDKDKVEEKIYPLSIDVRRFVQNLPEDGDYFQLTSSFTQLPNSYNLSKAFAEHVIDEEFQDLPLAVVRPTIVMAAMKEPEPGWSTSSLGSPTSIYETFQLLVFCAIYGIVFAQGMIAALAKGLVHTVHLDLDIIIDVVPADHVVNACIAAAWYCGTHRPGKIKIYHVGTSHLNPVIFRDFEKLVTRALHKNPPKDLVWYPSYVFRKSELLYKLEAYVYHQLPARVVDLFRVLRGKKPFMVRLYGKVDQLAQVLGFYFRKEVIFYADNLVELYESLNEKEQKEFDFDVRKLNWPSYFETFYHGVRTHVLRDDPSTITAARNEFRRMRRIHQFVVLCGVSFILLLICYVFSTAISC